MYLEYDGLPNTTWTARVRDARLPAWTIPLSLGCSRPGRPAVPIRWHPWTTLERAIGGPPSPLPPGRRIAAVWYTTDMDCGLPHEQVQEIESCLLGSSAVANRGLACRA